MSGVPTGGFRRDKEILALVLGPNNFLVEKVALGTARPSADAQHLPPFNGEPSYTDPPQRSHTGSLGAPRRTVGIEQSRKEGCCLGRCFSWSRGC